MEDDTAAPPAPAFSILLKGDADSDSIIASVGREELLDAAEQAVPELLRLNPDAQPESLALGLLEDAAEKLRPYYSAGNFWDAVHGGDPVVHNCFRSVAMALLLRAHISICAFAFHFGDKVGCSFATDADMFDEFGQDHALTPSLAKRINDIQAGGSREFTYEGFTFQVPANDLAEAMQMLSDEPRRDKLVAAAKAHMAKNFKRIKSKRASNRVVEKFFMNGLIWYADQQLRLN